MSEKLLRLPCCCPPRSDSESDEGEVDMDYVAQAAMATGIMPAGVGVDLAHSDDAEA